MKNMDLLKYFSQFEVKIKELLHQQQKDIEARPQLIVPQGPSGDRGTQGLIGAKGDQGDIGLTGKQGIKGTQGKVGQLGPKGESGIQGEQGLKGLSGISSTVIIAYANDDKGQGFTTDPKQGIHRTHMSFMVASPGSELKREDFKGTWHLWHPSAIVGRGGSLSVSALNNLSDVTVTSPSNGQVLSYNGTAWVNSAEAGLGDVTGPASSVDSSIALYDSTTGKLLKDSATTIIDEDTMVSDLDTAVPTQQSVKAYVDSQVHGDAWYEVTGTSQSMAINNKYIANNASLVTLTLPDTAVLGSTVEISGKGAGGWKIAQNAGEIIHYLGVDSTTGVGGSIASTNQYDTITLVCVTADTDWVVKAAMGNHTIV